MRQEIQSNLGDHINLAPRFGFVWSPKKDGSITIRGGAGVFYDWFTSQTFEQTLRVDGVRQRDLVITNPGFPDPFSNGTQLTLPPSRIQKDQDLETPYISRARSESKAGVRIVAVNDELSVPTGFTVRGTNLKLRSRVLVDLIQSRKRTHHSVVRYLSAHRLIIELVGKVC